MFAVLLFFALLYLLLFGVLSPLIGPYDFNHLTAYYELAWHYWRESPGLPSFNPYFCGGRTLAGDPQVPIFHPWVPFIGLLGPSVVLKLEMFWQLLLGTWGLWKWLDRWQVERAGREWGCLLYVSGGFVVAHFLVGHVTLGFYFLMPLYFLLSYRVCDRRDNAQLGTLATLTALCLYCGLYKPNFFLYAAPTLLIEAAARSFLSRRWRPLLLFAGLLTVTGLACAVTLLPSQIYFHTFPRTFDAGAKSIPWYTLLASLLVPLKSLPENWYGPAFLQRHEYSVFVGPVALYFAWRGLGRAWPWRAERLSLLVFAGACAWIGLGSPDEGFTPTRLYSWFANVWPGFSSIRVPVRFWYGVYLTLIVYSALGFRPARRTSWKVLFWAVGVAPLLVQSSVNLGKTLWWSWGWQGEIARAYPKEIALSHAEPDTPYSFIRGGVGVIECVDNLEAFRSPLLREGQTLQTRSEQPLTLRAQWRGWNTIALEGHRATRAPWSFNLNHHPYWNVEGTGVQIVSRPGDPLTLLAGPGGFSAKLVFRHPGVKAGLGISVGTLLLLAAGLGWAHRREEKPWLLGLTGGIASGKTSVATLLRERGWLVVDLDALARHWTSTDPETLSQIRKIFGDSVFLDDKLDRAKLRAAVFQDEKARRKLEAWLHPRLLAEFRRQAKASGARAVVCDAALLVETGDYRHFDRLIVVTAPTTHRHERLFTRDGGSVEQREAIFAAQAPDSWKIRVADYVVNNATTPEALRREVDRVVPFF